MDGPQILKRNDDTSTACAVVNKCLSTATKQQTDKSDSEFLLLNEHEHEHDHESNGECNSNPIMMCDSDEIESLKAHNNIECVSVGNETDRTIDL